MAFQPFPGTSTANHHGLLNNPGVVIPANYYNMAMLPGVPSTTLTSSAPPMMGGPVGPFMTSGAFVGHHHHNHNASSPSVLPTKLEIVSPPPPSFASAAASATTTSTIVNHYNGQQELGQLRDFGNMHNNNNSNSNQEGGGGEQFLLLSSPSSSAGVTPAPAAPPASGELQKTTGGTRSIFEWTKEKRQSLIDSVRCHTLLYDKADVEYRDRNARMRSWNIVGRQIGVHPSDAKQEWDTIRNRYVRSRDKELSSPNQAGFREYMFAKELRFLDGCITIRKKHYRANVPYPACSTDSQSPGQQESPALAHMKANHLQASPSAATTPASSSPYFPAPHPQTSAPSSLPAPAHQFVAPPQSPQNPHHPVPAVPPVRHPATNYLGPPPHSAVAPLPPPPAPSIGHSPAPLHIHQALPTVPSNVSPESQSRYIQQVLTDQQLHQQQHHHQQQLQHQLQLQHEQHLHQERQIQPQQQLHQHKLEEQQQCHQQHHPADQNHYPDQLQRQEHPPRQHHQNQLQLPRVPAQEVPLDKPSSPKIDENLTSNKPAPPSNGCQSCGIGLGAMEQLFANWFGILLNKFEDHDKNLHRLLDLVMETQTGQASPGAEATGLAEVYDEEDVSGWMTAVAVDAADDKHPGCAHAPEKDLFQGDHHQSSNNSCREEELMDISEEGRVGDAGFENGNGEVNDPSYSKDDNEMMLAATEQSSLATSSAHNQAHQDSSAGIETMIKREVISEDEDSQQTVGQLDPNSDEPTTEQDCIYQKDDSQTGANKQSELCATLTPDDSAQSGNARIPPEIAFSEPSGVPELLVPVTEKQVHSDSPVLDNVATSAGIADTAGNNSSQEMGENYNNCLEDGSVPPAGDCDGSGEGSASFQDHQKRTILSDSDRQESSSNANYDKDSPTPPCTLDNPPPHHLDHGTTTNGSQQQQLTNTLSSSISSTNKPDYDPSQSYVECSSESQLETGMDDSDGGMSSGNESPP